MNRRQLLKSLAFQCSELIHFAALVPGAVAVAVRRGASTGASTGAGTGERRGGSVGRSGMVVRGAGGGVVVQPGRV